MARQQTRDDILAAGMDLISRQGFNATGIEAVLKRAKVPKGSFYYYFDNKEDFGLAVIERFAQRFGDRLAALLAAEEVAPLARIRNYLEGGLERFEGNCCSKGCLVGNLGQEMADQHERFRRRLEEIFLTWQGQFAECLRQAQTAGEISGDLDPQATAEFLLSGWEGALLRAKVMKSTRPLRAFISILFDRVLR